MANKITSRGNEETERRYKAPALEKGLDILELLAKTGDPLTTSQIANKLERSVSELFRMVLALEARGYIAQAGGKEGYGLTNKLFSLGVAQTPTKTLIENALPVMKDLSEVIGQSCHLVVPSNDQIVVVARIESPLDLGFSVRVGYRRPIVEATSGVILCGIQPDDVKEKLLSKLSESTTPEKMEVFLKKVAQAGKEGYVVYPSDFVVGVTDLCSAIQLQGRTIAALTIPYVACNPEICSKEHALIHLRESVQKISETIA